MEKNKTIEEQMEAFFKMLKRDKDKVPFLIKFIERMVFDTMDFGSNGFQPVFAATLFAKQGNDKLEIIPRVVRTPDTNTYETFQFERLGELMNEAFKQYGTEVWGMTPIDEKEESRVASEDVLAQWGHLTKEQAH